MYASTSPPREFSRACLSVIIPFDVEIIAIPRPFNTRGTSCALAYTRNPGFEILFNPVITRSFLFPYFNVRTITSCTFPFFVV